MSGTWAVVPAKDFTRAKGRLAPVLDAASRARWARETLDHVLGVLAASGLPILVMTDAVAVAAHVRACGAQAVLTPAGIGDAVRQGVGGVALRGGSAALVVMGDLPELGIADLRRVLEQPGDGVICPDLRSAGTNGLLLRTLDPTRACFGHLDSFRRHRLANPGAGILRTAGWGRDVDSPADLVSLSPVAAGRATTSGGAT